MIKRTDGADAEKEKLGEKLTTSEKKLEGLETDTEKVLTSELTEAQKIWNDISSVKIDIFALSNQTVEMHAKPSPVDPAALYLTLNSAAAYPALDKALGERYDLEQVDRWTKISRKA